MGVEMEPVQGIPLRTEPMHTLGMDVRNQPGPPSSDGANPAYLAQFVEMGFPEAQARAALRASHNNREVALQRLVQNHS